MQFPGSATSGPAQERAAFGAGQLDRLLPHGAAAEHAAGPVGAGDLHLAQIDVEVDAGTEQHPWRLRCRAQLRTGRGPVRFVLILLHVDGELGFQHGDAQCGQPSRALDDYLPPFRIGHGLVRRVQRIVQRLQKEGKLPLPALSRHFRDEGLLLRGVGRIRAIVDEQLDAGGAGPPAAARRPTGPAARCAAPSGRPRSRSSRRPAAGRRPPAERAAGYARRVAVLYVQQRRAGVR